jgi:hypothetical protein
MKFRQVEYLIVETSVPNGSGKAVAAREQSGVFALAIWNPLY